MKKDSNALILTIQTEMKMTLWDCIKFRIAGLYKCQEWNKYINALSGVINKSAANACYQPEGKNLDVKNPPQESSKPIKEN